MKKVLDKIVVPEELSTYIESLDYEVQARKSLITFAMTKGLVNTEAFNKCHTEYREFFMQFETAKQELYKKFVEEKWGGKNVNWTLYYSDHCIEITEGV